MVVHDHALLVDFNGPVVHFADADPSDVFVVIDRADQHLRAGVRVARRGGDVVDDRLEQGLHAGPGASEVKCGDP